MAHVFRTLFGFTLAIAVAAAPIVAGTVTFTETFDGGSNEGGWTWGFGDTIAPTGGNPGAYLRTEGLDTFAPSPRTTTGGVFIGDYRARQVTSIGVDLITFSADFSAADRALTLMLIHDNDTPGDPFDDTAAYFLGPDVPLPGESWLSYDFAVPSQETTLPSGWQLLNLGDSGAAALHDWNQIIQHVSEVVFHYGDPTFFYIFQQWTLGLDNPRITTEAGGGDPGDDSHVTLCHQPPGNSQNAHTITVGANAVPAHLAHGDTLGPCSGNPEPVEMQPAGPGSDGPIGRGRLSTVGRARAR